MTVQSTPDHDHPVPGYYPDPSIPGFVRYWDGDAWTPGSARRAPAEGEVLPPPKNARPRPQVEETGPVFLDEAGAASLWTAREHVPATPLTWGVPHQPEPHAVAGLPAREPGRTWPEPESEPEAQASPGRPLPAWLEEQTGDWSDAAVFAREAAQRQDAEAPAGEGGQLEAGAHEFTAPTALRHEPAAGAGSVAERTAPSASAGGAPQLTPPTRESAQQGPVGRTAPRGGAPLGDPIDGSPTTDRDAGGLLAGPGAPGGRASVSGPEGAETASPVLEFAAGGPDGRPSNPRRSEALPAGPGAREGAAAAEAQSAPVRGQLPSPARESRPARDGVTAPAGRHGQAHARPAGRQTRAGDGEGAGSAVRDGAAGPGGAALDAATASVRAARPARGARAGALTPAPGWRRVGARVVDLVLTLGTAAALAGVPLVQGVVTHLQDKVDAARVSGLAQRVWFVDPTVLGSAGALLAVVFGLGLVYEAVPTALRGRTLGKALFGLRVVDARSRACPGLGRAVGRLLSTTLLLGLGRDRLGRTRVVRAARNAGRRPVR